MKSKKRKTYHHGDLKRTLMTVALDAIRQHGVDSLTLRTLATRAGVSSGAPYHHFGGRDELLAALATEGFELLASRMLHAREASDASPAVRLKSLGIAYVDFARTHIGHFKVMFRGELQGAAGSALAIEGERAFGLLREAVEQRQQAGQAPAGDSSPLVLYAWTTVHGLASLMIDGSLKKIPLPTDKLPAVVTELTERLFGALAGLGTGRQAQTPAC